MNIILLSGYLITKLCTKYSELQHLYLYLLKKVALGYIRANPGGEDVVQGVRTPNY